MTDHLKPQKNIKQQEVKPNIQPNKEALNLWRYRLNITLRTLIAIFGTYALATAFANFSAQILVIFGIERISAYQAAIMLAFLVQAIAIMWIFHQPNLRQIVLSIIMPSLILGSFSYLLATKFELAI